MGNCGLKRLIGEEESASADISAATPYRVSCESAARFNGGVWKVKLVISQEQLCEILSQESRTEALIESVRTVANIRSGASSSSSSSSVASSSDHWSVSSSSG